VPEDNCTDILAQCLGFLAISGERPAGGLQPVRRRRAGADEQQAGHVPAATRSRSGSSTRTRWSRRRRRSCKLFRDHGNRSDRKRARLKYVMHDWGVEKFRDVF
jgi:sulfite reductase (ferredoxin)